MKTRLMTAIAALALVGAACSNDENEPIVDNWNGEIRLTSGVSALVPTRSIATDLQTAQMAKDVHVGFFIDEQVETGGSASTTYTQNLDYTAKGDGTFAGTTVYFPQSGNGVNIYAYAPRKNGLTLAGNYAFTVPADQSTEPNYLAADLLWGQPMKEKADEPGEYEPANPVARTKESIPVSFAHRLAKVNVKLIPGDGLTADNFKGATLSVLNTKPTVSMKLADGSLAEATGTAIEITAAQFSADATPTALTASAIVVPQTVGQGTKFLKLHLATGGDLYYTLPAGADLVLASGKVYSYEITAKLTSLAVTSTIEEWEPIGATPIEGDAVMD